jgi:prevent-host-death family protein
MGISLTRDIRSITDLKRNTNSLLEQVRKTNRPLVLTVNGKAEAVLLGADEFERISNAFTLLKSLVPAEEDVREGRYKEARAFFKEFRHAKKI